MDVILTDEEVSTIKGLMIEFLECYCSEEKDKKLLELHDRLVSSDLMIAAAFSKCLQIIEYKFQEARKGCFAGFKEFVDISIESKLGKKALFKRVKSHRHDQRIDVLYNANRGIHHEIVEITDSTYPIYFKTITEQFPERFI